jgi:NADP-dependent 3-hydroxy acid dehydrogenase YdfG
MYLDGDDPYLIYINFNKKIKNLKKMKNGLLNKKIVITGTSSGIGYSTATYFLNRAAEMILVGNDIEILKTLVNNFQIIHI